MPVSAGSGSFSSSRPMRKRPHSQASATLLGSAAALVPADALVSDEPPSRRARRDVLSTQVETLEAELEHERSLRSLDQKKFKQAQQRLERKVEFAVEEANEAKALMEESAKESQEYAERLRAEHARLRIKYRDLQTTLDEERAAAAEADAEEDPTVLALEDRLQAREEECEGLQQTITDLRKELQATLEERSALKEPDSPEPPASPAPPGVMRELNHVRLQLADSERKNRQLRRSMEDLQKQAKELVRQQEQTKSATARLHQLEQTLGDREQSLATTRAELDHWKIFGKSLAKFLADASPNTKTASGGDPNLPPEMSVIQRCWQEANQDAQEAVAKSKQTDQQLKQAKETILALQSKLRQSEQAQTSWDQQQKDMAKKLLVAEKQAQVSRGQEAVWKREVDSLRSIVEAFDELPLPGKTNTTPAGGDAQARMTKARLDAAREELGVVKEGQAALRKELDTALQEKADLQKTHSTVLEKFGKLREAVYAERAKAEQAEARAVQAEELAGKGSFNPETTRVLHLKNNPLTEALKQEVQVLRRQNEVLSSAGSGVAAAKSAAVGADVDPNKLHQRLKQSFKEQIGRFREGVYLITGYKIDMIPEGDRPKFKVRSMFAEQEKDHLMFQWPEGSAVESLDLLDTKLAKLLTTTPSYEYVQRFHSLPAFLASVQLSLFEKQTMM